MPYHALPVSAGDDVCDGSHLSL